MLESSTMVITGAAGTLGQATARCAHRHGARIIGLDVVDTNSLSHVDDYHQVDLTDREATAACFLALGQFESLVNVAGGFAMGTAAAAPDDEQWDWMFRINVDTMRNATMAAVPQLREREHGAIVNIGALGALSGQADMSAYCCAKSTVMKLTESLSAELKGDGINVNAVLPSIIDTPPNRDAMPDANFEDWVGPGQLAEVICFLASRRAIAVHGALVPVTGLV